MCSKRQRTRFHSVSYVDMGRLRVNYVTRRQPRSSVYSTSTPRKLSIPVNGNVVRTADNIDGDGDIRHVLRNTPSRGPRLSSTQSCQERMETVVNFTSIYEVIKRWVEVMGCVTATFQQLSSRNKARNCRISSCPSACTGTRASGFQPHVSQINKAKQEVYTVTRGRVDVYSH